MLGRMRAPLGKPQKGRASVTCRLGVSKLCLFVCLFQTSTGTPDRWTHIKTRSKRDLLKNEYLKKQHT